MKVYTLLGISPGKDQYTNRAVIAGPFTSRQECERAMTAAVSRGWTDVIITTNDAKTEEA